MILFLQPRHVYAPPPDVEKIGHVYLPSALLSAASRVMLAGLPVTIVDENLEAADSFPDTVGINIIGPPYIPAAQRVQARARSNRNARFIIGGQGINGLSKAQFLALFGEDSTDGNDPACLSQLLGIDPGRLPAPESAALVSAYKNLSEGALRLYLASEFSLYLSQGCRFSCTFCGANRSGMAPDGSEVRVRERYRAMAAIRADLDFLFGAAKDFGLSVLSIYLSNLDLFQTPPLLRTFTDEILALRRKWPGVELRMRGLSTATSFCAVADRDPQLIKDLRHAGLERVGFGVDGATPSVWYLTNKPVAREDVPLRAIRECRQNFSMMPETLMVFGHNTADTEQSLELANRFMEEMFSTYGAIPRPHVAKDVVPGNDGWRDTGRQPTVEFLLRQPSAFQLLDFTTLPSWLTHRDEGFREVVTKAYLKACSLPGAMTQYTLPEDPGLPHDELTIRHAFNMKKYDL